MAIRLSCALYLLSYSLFSMEPSVISSAFVTKGRYVQIESNHSLIVENETIDRIIVAIQGNKREAKARVNAVMNAAVSIDGNERALILSPNFKIKNDNPNKSELRWLNNGWKQGDPSTEGAGVSSFTVLDSLITSIIDGGIFPNIKKVVVSGHSAGGQFAQRYALTSAITEKHQNIDFSFVVINPSSYTYLNELRPQQDATFSKPDAALVTFNKYKYGLTKRNAYGKLLTKSKLRTQYLSRSVYYVLGQLDVDPQQQDLDTTFPAMMQGYNRLNRGRNYVAYLNEFFLGHNHQQIEIPNVGHDADGMYRAKQVLDILFR